MIDRLRDSYYMEEFQPENHLTEVFSSCGHVIDYADDKQAICTICNQSYSSLLFLMNAGEGEHDMNEHAVTLFIKTVLQGDDQSFRFANVWITDDKFYDMHIKDVSLTF